MWYGCYFGESTENLTFVPPGLSPEFAAQLRKVAWQVVQEDSPAGKAENAQQKPPCRRWKAIVTVKSRELANGSIAIVTVIRLQLRWWQAVDQSAAAR